MKILPLTKHPNYYQAIVNLQHDENFKQITEWLRMDRQAMLENLPAHVAEVSTDLAKLESGAILALGDFLDDVAQARNILREIQR